MLRNLELGCESLAGVEVLMPNNALRDCDGVGPGRGSGVGVR
jgi:hypothetical protein